MRPYRTQAPTLAQQAFRLKMAQPGSSVRFDKHGNRMVWDGCLSPTAISDIYQTRIICTRQQPRPLVFIVAPTLLELNGEPIPHRYEDNSLCLWQPAYHEWRSAFWIAETVIGWTSLWLFFYELWHACGEWLGGGEHPGEYKTSDEYECSQSIETSRFRVDQRRLPHLS